MKKIKSIAVLGTRGIPANYSGFETCVQETANILASWGYRVRVYCRKGKVGTGTMNSMKIEQIFVPYISGKHLETISHTMFSMIHAVFHRVDCVHLYGVGNGWFVPLLRLLGFKVVFMMDGIDWYRNKWSSFAKKFLKLGARVGSRFANSSTADSYHVINTLKSDFVDRNFLYVPYGAKIVKESAGAKLDELKLKTGEYFLFVGRFVPEKNVDLLVRAFESANTDRYLVVVGGSSYDQDYEKKIRSTTCKKILFTGFVFGKLYEELISNCYVYIQPSALEGTSPSLLGSMGAGACVLVSDIPENQETVGDAGFYFKSNDEANLSKMITYLDQNSNEVLIKRGQALLRVKNTYSWENVTGTLLEVSQRP